MLFKRKTDDYVDLSIGRVYLRPLTSYIVKKSQSGSTVIKDVINNAAFFYLIEKSLVLLSGRKYRRLSIVDGNKLREKVREVLFRHGVINNSVKQESGFSEEEKKVFGEQYEDLTKNYLTGN